MIEILAKISERQAALGLQKGMVTKEGILERNTKSFVCASLKRSFQTKE
jgi:hypothetical protein